jgi:hypothetical protein
LQRKEKIAIVRYQAHERSQVRFCALLPSVGSEIYPAGFQLVLLPYAEDIRDLDAIME